MEGDRPNRLSDYSDKNEFDDEIYNQLNSENKDNSSKKTKSEKANVVAVIVVAIVAIFLGVYAVADGINNPFSFLDNKDGDQQITTSTQSNFDSDTDKDGLTDYDEINVYGSSPYLEDTDGDGIKDADEIKAKSDPNCPQGQTCSGGFKFSSSTSVSVPTFGTPDSPSVSVDPATIRQVLIQGGMNADDINQLTDAQILQLYNEAVSSDSSSGAQATSTGTLGVPTKIDVTDLKISSIDDLKNLTGAQIKALMIKNGAPESLLNQMSDDEIKKMLVDKIEENK